MIKSVCFLIIFLVAFHASAIDSPNIKAVRFRTLNIQRVEDLLARANSVSNLAFPSNITIEEQTNYRMIGTTYFHNRIVVDANPQIYEYLVHEYGHALLHFNLSSEVPIFREQQAKLKRIEYLSSRAGTESSQAEIRRLSNEVNSNPNLRLLSVYFEEVFSDLLTALVFENAAVMDNDGSGNRNFAAEITNNIPLIWWDPHLLFQPLGKFIFQTYIREKSLSSQQVLRAFYQLMKNEIEQSVHSEHLIAPNNGLIVRRTQGGLLVNGKHLLNYIDELKQKFERIIIQ
jgi:hypothetical protein